MVSRFERMGSVKDESKCERSKTATNDNKALEILQTVMEKSHTPVSKVVSQNDISQTSVWKILKKGYHPYKSVII